jgi:hypothetical protein
MRHSHPILVTGAAGQVGAIAHRDDFLKADLRKLAG